MLIVEDDALVARGLRRALAPAAEIVVVHSHAAATEALSHPNAFAVVWSDLDLGTEANGIDVLGLAARTQPHARLLLVTGSPDQLQGRALDARVRVFHKADATTAIADVLAHLAANVPRVPASA